MEPYTFLRNKILFFRLDTGAEQSASEENVRKDSVIFLIHFIKP